MFELRLGIATVVAIALGATVVPITASAKDEWGGDSFSATVELPGYENPPGTGKYENPCAGHTDFTVRISEATGVIKNDEGSLGVDLGGEVTEGDGNYVVAWGGGVGWELPLANTFNIEFIEWRTACGADDPDAPLDEEPKSEKRYWIRKPTQGSIVPGLLALVNGQLTPPTVTWPDKDPEHNWLYVNAAMDFRVDPIDQIRETKTISNLADTVTAWVQADPVSVVFEPGEPGGKFLECGYQAALAPYVQSTPGRCSYKYKNSSSIAPNNVFNTTTSVFWTVTTSSAEPRPPGRSWRRTNIPVAEIQAIEVLTTD